MKATIGVYNTREEAVAAVNQLKLSGYSTKRVSIIGRHEKFSIDERIENQNKITSMEGKEVGLGAAVGSALGILTGAGLFAIPGFGWLFGAGALVGAIAGFDIGLLSGGLFAALSISSVKDHHLKGYDTHLNDGRFLLIAQGNEEETNRAHDILMAHGTHTSIDKHH